MINGLRKENLASTEPSMWPSRGILVTSSSAPGMPIGPLISISRFIFFDMPDSLACFSLAGIVSKCLVCYNSAMVKFPGGPALAS